MIDLCESRTHFKDIIIILIYFSFIFKGFLLFNIVLQTWVILAKPPLEQIQKHKFKSTL